MDEAYIEFSDADSVALQLARFDNLVVLRTLSKAWGLAGTRCGAVIGNEGIIELLGRLVPPYAFSTPSSDRVLQSLSRVGESNARKLVAETIAERERVRNALRDLPCVTRVWPSDANFLLVKFASLGDVSKLLAQNHVLVRAFADSPLLANCARITIGTIEQNDQLLKALDDQSGSRS
ncbi:MAG: aminotransferase class I/II-fold pyridoxal phosphate-dependent enzyme [Woeseia sp.]|nr:aminotransferase class I/II-fold pyridoxal phosphate-dependent enzyme [Woeseia sp.]